MYISTSLDYILLTLKLKGGVLTARVSWRWVFYLVAIIAIPFSVLSFIALPKHTITQDSKSRKLDWQDVMALTGGLILFVYAISDANDSGQRYSTNFKFNIF